MSSETIWTFLGSLLVHGQSFLVYPLGYVERPRDVHEPTVMGIPFEDLRLTTPDGVTIACHLMLYSELYAKLYDSRYSSPRDSRQDMNPSTSLSKNDEATQAALAEEIDIIHATDIPAPGPRTVAGRATVVMFHGNAMNNGDIIDLAAQYLDMGCNVMTVSYRGYGHSTGTPSESGLKMDSQTALDYLVQHPTLSKIPIIIYGQSLGGAVAIDLVSRNSFHGTGISALIIENTFMSIPALVHDWPSPFGPLSFLCTQRWPSINRIPDISKDIPILMLSGDQDIVVPPKHMQGLWVAAKSRGDQDEEADEGGEDRHLTCSSSFFWMREKSKRRRKKASAVDLEHAVADEMGDLKSPASIWDGKNLFRFFSGTGHENTSLDDTYWATIHTFLGGLDLPEP